MPPILSHPFEPWRAGQRLAALSPLLLATGVATLAIALATSLAVEVPPWREPAAVDRASPHAKAARLERPALPPATHAAAGAAEPPHEDRRREASIRRIALGIDFERFALNALLLPLLDSADPPRWAPWEWSFPCDAGTRVLVDGEPFVPGALLPSTSFRLRWELRQCGPFFGSLPLLLSGAVELSVFRDDDGFSAVVLPDGLALVTEDAEYRLTLPFGAALALGSSSDAP